MTETQSITEGFRLLASILEEAEVQPVELPIEDTPGWKTSEINIEKIVDYMAMRIVESEPGHDEPYILPHEGMVILYVSAGAVRVNDTRDMRDGECFVMPPADLRFVRALAHPSNLISIYIYKGTGDARTTQSDIRGATGASASGFGAGQA